MTKRISYTIYQDFFEYHGNTTIERIRKENGTIILHDWLIFNSVEEATEYFNSN